MDMNLDNTKRGEVPNPFLRWGEALLCDPQAAVADILSGRGARGAQQRAEPEDFFADLLAHPRWQEQGTVLAAKLDSALWQWLLERIEWPLARIAEQGARAYAAELSDTLAVVARLPLTRTAQGLIKDLPRWDNRLSGLRWPGDIDLLLRLDMVLIRHQPDTRFVPRWFAACERAAWSSPYWRADLSTGLLGLRKMPHAPDTRPERPVACALARFAALAADRGMSPPEAEKAFRRAAATLTVLYPRQDDYWRRLWTEVLDDLPYPERDQVRRIGSEWLAGILSAGTGSKQSQPKSRQKGKGHSRYPDLPTKEELDRLIADLRRAGRLQPSLGMKVRGLMGRHWAYAETTGESRFAVMSLHNLGVRILRLHPGQDLLAELQRWTLQGLELEPENPFIWGLWAKVLSALGETESALAVRWEAIRRFPGNPVLRVELAEVLRRNACPVLAERLLRQTMHDFPRNEVCRNALAELLRQTHRLEEAELLLRQTMHDFPRNEVCRNALAELLRQTRRLEEAEGLLRQTMRDFPRNEVCRNALAELLRETRRLEEVERLLRQTMRDFPRNEICRVALAELLRETHRLGEAEELLHQTMRDFPRNEVCRNALAELLRQTDRLDDAEGLLRQTMRDFRRDVVCRHVLALMLWRQHRQGEAETVLAEARSLAPNNPYVSQLGRCIRVGEQPPPEYKVEHVPPRGFYLRAGLESEGEGAGSTTGNDLAPGGIGAGTQTASAKGGERRDSDQARRESEEPAAVEPRAGREDPGGSPREPEPGTVSSPLGPGPTTKAFLSHLVRQKPWMEWYFSDPAAPEAGKTIVAELAAGLEAGESDLALVVAHRVGLLEGQGGKSLLERWIRVRPSSYSANLLLAWHGDNGGDGPGQATMGDVARRFPEHRRWNDWLLFPSLTKENRVAPRQDLRDSRNPRDRKLWDDRLSAVYPDMEGGDDEEETRVDPIARKRLVQDIALAGAERAVPSIPMAA